MSSPPQAPDSLPKYIQEGVPKQDDQTLRQLQNWIDELLEYRHDLDEEDIVPEDGDQIEEVDTSGKKTKVVKKVKCGKSSCKCATSKSEWHGPYEYRCWREGNSLKWEYVGPVNT